MATSETSSVKATNNKSTIIKKVLDDESTIEVASDEEDLRDADSVTLVVVSGAGVNAGVVTLEGAMEAGYTGTWLSLGALTINAASKIFGKTIDLSDDPNPVFPFVRARISTGIGVGTVDVYLVIRR